MSSWQIVKKFLSPLAIHPRGTFWACFNDVLIALFVTYSVVFLQYISKAVEQQNMEIFWKRGIIWIVVVTIRTIFGIFYKAAPLSVLRNSYSYLYDLYMKKIFLGDNTKIEKL